MVLSLVEQMRLLIIMSCPYRDVLWGMLTKISYWLYHHNLYPQPSHKIKQHLRKCWFPLSLSLNWKPLKKRWQGLETIICSFVLLLVVMLTCLFICCCCFLIVFVLFCFVLFCVMEVTLELCQDKNSNYSSNLFINPLMCNVLIIEYKSWTKFFYNTLLFLLLRSISRA